MSVPSRPGRRQAGDPGRVEPGRLTVHAVLLAAGAGTRFGPGGAKLLASWRGRSLIEHVLATLASARDAGVIGGGVVVYSPGGERIRDLATGSGFDAVLASRADLGLSESLKAGFVTLQVTTDPREVVAALICLGDQPRLSVEAIAAVVAAAEGAGTRLVRPSYADDPKTPGHPILIGRAHWSLIAETEGDRGLDPVVRKHGLGWREVPVTGGNPDVDTPADLDRLEGA